MCTSYGSRPEAVVGEKLTLHCYLDSYCPTYKWTLITEDNNKIPQNETGNKLVVSTNVSSISEVGGKLYECQCHQENGDCQLFRIGGMYRMCPQSVAYW